MNPPPRVATLVLVTPDGDVVGELPPVPVATPWWQDIEPVVDAVRDRLGVETTVLRLLESELDIPHGGGVTYLAEIDEPVPAQPWHGMLDEQPLRQRWARVGGPAADLAWADAALTELGLRRSGPARQIRSWNLSSLWRIPVADGWTWLKVVPPFFGHEGSMLARLAGGPVPTLLARDGERILMAEIAGEDLYDADVPVLLDMVSILVDLQRDSIGSVDELLALGLPDWRGPALTAAIADVVVRHADELAVDERAALDAFVDGLSARFSAVGSCGLPDALVHGDCHPGNARGTAASVTLLDWGDSGVGHPLLDQPGFLDRIEEAGWVAPVAARWLELWREAVPGSDPGRAAELLAPIAAARMAVIYRKFLDDIEPSEQAYHRADVPDWLHRTAALLGPAEQRPAPAEA